MTAEEWTAVRLSLLIATTATIFSLPLGIAIAEHQGRPGGTRDGGRITEPAVGRCQHIAVDVPHRKRREGKRRT